MCGSQAGYPHHPQCAFPYYGSSVKRQNEWTRATNGIRKSLGAGEVCLAMWCCHDCRTCHIANTVLKLREDRHEQQATGKGCHGRGKEYAEA
jgi:hypothetical protein